MLNNLVTFITAAIISISGAFGIHSQTAPIIQLPVTTPIVSEASAPSIQASPSIQPSPSVSSKNSIKSSAVSSQKVKLAATQKVLSQNDLLTLAGTDYADGNVPLGDNKYVTSAPRQGYVYLCNVHTDNQGAYEVGPWINGTSWNINSKKKVSGAVMWPNATFSNTIRSNSRVLSGNGLPVGFTTGTFPIQSSDPASNYDRNPNSIKVQSIKVTLPLNPTYSDTPYCMGGEVGMMLNGVPLFDGFDAGLRDAPAHELQDSCDGHPQESGEYHYHSLSSCFKDISVETVLGFAYDGFPITGPMVTNSMYLTTKDLDECHGITSEFMLDGKKTITYHYVMTKDFPYSASCFRGKAVNGPTAPPQGQTSNQTGVSRSSQANPPMQQNGQPGQTPPAEAVSACANMQINSSCSFTSPRGDTISGMCRQIPQGTTACVPQ